MKRRQSVQRLAKRQRDESCRFFFELTPTTADEKAKNPRWIQIARTGLWKGYRAKRTVEFTTETFKNIIDNFHEHPSYKAGADGKGSADVIPWDFNHASEMDPTEGDLPVVGAPAQAWVQELEMRAGADGKTGLWSLTKLLEPVLSYIKDGKIKWASVTVWPNAIDPESGEQVGALLTSVAFTNQPFIEGMEPIAASSYGINGRYFDPASDAEDAFMQLRKLFGLSQTSVIGDVMAEIGKLRMWLSSGVVPMGVDADGLISCMRTILGLPALSSTDEVFAELDKLVPALIDQQALEATESGSDVPSENSSASVTTDGGTTASKRKDDMDAKILASLAAVLGLKASTEEAILAGAESAMGARSQLVALQKGLGASDQDGATKRIADLVAAEKELVELKPKHLALSKRVDVLDNAEAEAEVALVIEEHKLPDTMSGLLLDYRKRDIEKFRKEFPITPADKQHLTRTVFASTDDAQFGSTKTGGNKKGTNERSGEAGDLLSQVEGYPGRNRVEQCMAFIRGNTPGAKDWTHEQLHAQGCELNKKLGPPARRSA